MGFFKRRSIKSLGKKKREMPEGLWHKCPDCGAIIHEADLQQHYHVCPKCSHHFTMGAWPRINMLTDPDSFVEMDKDLESLNPLDFKAYTEKIKGYQKKTGLKDAIITGRAKIMETPVVMGVMDFSFLGGSLGSVVGEKVTRAIEAATEDRCAVLLVCASGGARMHEGILSLMQMAKTSAALARHHDAGLAYIGVLTHPTTGGVTASFAALGDVILAEPKCMIGFAGPRVVKETTHQNLPPGFQTAEFVMKHGLVDMIVNRADLRERLGKLVKYMEPTTA